MEEDDASYVRTNRTPRTMARVSNRESNIRSCFFFITTTCITLFLVVCAYRGDDLPSKHLPGFLIYALTLGASSSLWFWHIVLVHDGYNLPLWEKRCFYVACVAWLAAAITITVLFKGTYNCLKINKTEPLAFRHCHTLVTLQAFLWIVAVHLSIYSPLLFEWPVNEDPRPPRPSLWSRWMQRRTRGGQQGTAAEVVDEFRRRNDLEAGGGAERVLGDDGGDAARRYAQGADGDGQRPNAIEMSMMPGPEEPPINLGAIPGPPEPK